MRQKLWFCSTGGLHPDEPMEISGWTGFWRWACTHPGLGWLYDMRLLKHLAIEHGFSLFSMNDVLFYQEMQGPCHKTQIKMFVPLIQFLDILGWTAKQWCLPSLLFTITHTHHFSTLVQTFPWTTTIQAVSQACNSICSFARVGTNYFHAPWEGTRMGFENTCLGGSSFQWLQGDRTMCIPKRQNCQSRYPVVIVYQYPLSTISP